MKSALEQEIDDALQGVGDGSLESVSQDADGSDDGADGAEVQGQGEPLMAPPADKPRKRGRAAADDEPQVWVPGRGEEPKTFLALFCRTDGGIYFHDEKFAERGDMQLVEVTRARDGQFRRVLKK